MKTIFFRNFDSESLNEGQGESSLGKNRKLVTELIVQQLKSRGLRVNCLAQRLVRNWPKIRMTKQWAGIY